MSSWASYRVEALGAIHDRLAFISGAEKLDHYFHHIVTQDAKRKVAVPYVILDDTDEVIGYYTLSGYTIRLGGLPSHLQKKLPKYPLLPATLLGRLAIRHDRQGQKLGQWLLMDALHRSWINSKQVASIGVVVDVLNDNALAFYRHHEFIGLEAHTNKLFLPLATIENLFT